MTSTTRATVAEERKEATMTTTSEAELFRALPRLAATKKHSR
jgi:hypothetical protein